MCVRLCETSIERAFSTDRLNWSLPGAATCEGGAPLTIGGAAASASALVCETQQTVSRVSDTLAYRNCENFQGLPISLIGIGKAAAIALFSLVCVYCFSFCFCEFQTPVFPFVHRQICDQIMTQALKQSQSIEWRTATRRIYLRKPTLSFVAYFICLLFFGIAVTLTVVGGLVRVKRKLDCKKQNKTKHL